MNVILALLQVVISQQFGKLASCMNACNYNKCIHLLKKRCTARKTCQYTRQDNQDNQTQAKPSSRPSYYYS